MREHQGHRRPDQIMANIDRTRGEMDRTLSEIEQRLSPQQLLNQGLDYVKRSGAAEFTQNLGGAARQNPLPVALTGIGIAWLMAFGRQPAQSYEVGSMAGMSGDETGESIKDRVAGAAERMTGGVRSMKQRAGEKLGSIRERTRETAGTVTETTRAQWSRARTGLEHFAQEQPLMIGAIGLAIGAALGASAPRTPQEQRLLGEASRKVADRAKQMGGQQLAKAREMMDRTRQESDDSAQAQAAEPAERSTDAPSGNGGIGAGLDRNH